MAMHPVSRFPQPEMHPNDEFYLMGRVPKASR